MTAGGQADGERITTREAGIMVGRAWDGLAGNGRADRTGAGAGGGSNRVRVEPRLTTLGRLRVIERGEDSAREAGKGPVARHALVDIDGEHCRISQRFWKSVFCRYRFGASTFRYFRPEEVFRRICEVSRDDQLRVMVERPEKGPPVALAVSRPGDALVEIDDVRDLARRHGATNAFYANGMVSCTFTPKSGEKALAIGGDDFSNRFTLDVPIDGHGHASIHVALVRLICANGAVAHHRLFANDIPASRDPRHTLERAVDCFDHADGYAAIRERFLSAQTSWASVRDAHSLHRQLVKTTFNDPARKSAVLHDFDRVTGRIHEFYGVTNLDTLPVRRQRLLPVKCRVYDLLNFASEVATHATAPAESRHLHAWIGGTLAEEFDLEGTAEEARDFADLLLDGRGGAATPRRSKR